MTLRDFLSLYDIKEGDLLECENGEVYIIKKEVLYEEFALLGPQPNLKYNYLDKGLSSKRILRPRWVIGNNTWINLEVLQPRKPAKPTITVNVPKGFEVKVVEND